MSVQPHRRLFTVEEPYRMAEAGILSADERVELIEGEIVALAAIGSRHAACVDRLNYLADVLAPTPVMASAISRLRSATVRLMAATIAA
jgi:hypothetical protein